MFRNLALPVALLVATGAFAQESTKEGYALQWKHELRTTTDTLRNGPAKTPVEKVTVHETRANAIAGLIRSAVPGAVVVEEKGTINVTGANLSGIQTPVDLTITTNENKKAGSVELVTTVLQQGIPYTEDGKARNAAIHDLGVKLNKAVVQSQISTWEGKLVKANKELESAIAGKAKAENKAASAKSDLEKNQTKRANLERQLENVKADIVRQDSRWKTSQNPKDLSKLTKLREKQTKVEKNLASNLSSEAKKQKTLDKTQGSLPNAEQEHEKVTESAADIERIITSLKNKLEAIR